MSDPAHRSAEWVYQGVWSVLADCFMVPKHAPTLPAAPDEFYRSFHPSRRYLSYLKMVFWMMTLLVDGAILVLWVVVMISSPLIAAVIAIPMLVVAVVPDIVAYVAIHLRYDTMWYVMTDRSLRLRRGIWTIMEHTITYENVQNVYLTRGPIQQLFGFATIVVETAGASGGEHGNVHAVGNKAILEGIAEPEEIRDLILERVRKSRTAGLGDDQTNQVSHGWTSKQRQLLREIRDDLVNRSRR